MTGTDQLPAGQQFGVILERLKTQDKVMADIVTSVRQIEKATSEAATAAARSADDRVRLRGDVEELKAMFRAYMGHTHPQLADFASALKQEIEARQLSIRDERADRETYARERRTAHEADVKRMDDSVAGMKAKIDDLSQKVSVLVAANALMGGVAVVYVGGHLLKLFP